MSPTTISDPALPAAYVEPHWYAIYTRLNREKSLAEHLRAREIEHFLPLASCVHRWSDRRKIVHLPLFPNYVFARFALCHRLSVLQVPSAISLVGFGSSLPAIVPDEDIETLRSAFSHGLLKAHPHPYLAVGQRVRIMKGALEGIEGFVSRKKGALRVVLSINLIKRSIAVEVDCGDLQMVPTESPTERLAGFALQCRHGADYAPARQTFMG